MKLPRVAMYKHKSVKATITTRFGIPYHEVEERCIMPLLADPDYEVVHAIESIYFSANGKHFGMHFTLTAKDHDITEEEINTLLKKYCVVKALQ